MYHVISNFCYVKLAARVDLADEARHLGSVRVAGQPPRAFGVAPFHKGESSGYVPARHRARINPVVDNRDFGIRCTWFVSLLLPHLLLQCLAPYKILQLRHS
jgi:hypothetical protein